MIERPDGVSQDVVDAIARRLTDQVTDKTLHQAITRAQQMARDANPAETGLLAILSEAVREMEEHGDAERVLVGGVSNIAGDLALWRVETMRRLFDALEHEADVLRLLRTAASNEEPSVTIGAEHPSTGEWEASVVAAPYRAGETSLGTIGVVGPTRMDYQTTITAVRAVAKRLSDLAEELGG
jgi:heat-inducible transcriptional repressor